MHHSSSKAEEECNSTSAGTCCLHPAQLTQKPVAQSMLLCRSKLSGPQQCTSADARCYCRVRMWSCLHMEHQDQARAIPCRYGVAALEAAGVNHWLHCLSCTSSMQCEALLCMAQDLLMQDCVHCSRQGCACAVLGATLALLQLRIVEQQCLCSGCSTQRQRKTLQGRATMDLQQLPARSSTTTRLRSGTALHNNLLPPCIAVSLSHIAPAAVATTLLLFTLCCTGRH